MQDVHSVGKVRGIQKRPSELISSTGKPVSEALILESVNPQYDKRLLIEFIGNTSSEHVLYKHCFEFKNKNKNNFCTQHVLNQRVIRRELKVNAMF